MQKVIDAMNIATAAHAGQRYGRVPNDVAYVFHLAATVGVLLRVEIVDRDLLAAAWLHDVLEDTNVTEADLTRMLNSRIAAIVRLVTNPPGKNRAARHAAMQERLLDWPNRRDRLDAATVKLADRIANVEASLLSGDTRLRMYEREQTGFDAMIERALGPGENDGHLPATRLRLMLDRLFHPGRAP